MRHDVGQGCRDNEATEINHAGFFTDDDQHLVSQTSGQPCFCEYQSDHDRGKDEHDRGHHEIRKCIPGRTDQEQRLQDPDGQAGDADGNHLEDPPGAGQQKYGDGPLGLPGQREMLARGIHRIGPGRCPINHRKENNAQEKKPHLFPVDISRCRHIVIH